MLSRVAYFPPHIHLQKKTLVIGINGEICECFLPRKFPVIQYPPLHASVLTCDLWFGSHPGEVLRPEGRNRASKLKEGGVASVGMKVRRCIVDDLLCLYLVGDVPLIVRASFEKTCPGKVLGTTGNHGEVDGSPIDRNVWWLEEKLRKKYGVAAILHVTFSLTGFL